uniref:Uncharacterized protein n=1 Tax=Rhizophora mucronata TaxID=61149 RepID=A0A2P2N610_RHIMU
MSLLQWKLLSLFCFLNVINKIFVATSYNTAVFSSLCCDAEGP